MGAKTYEDRAKDARATLETYNAWANGQVFGYSLEAAEHETEECDDLDSCWGFYEGDSMSEQIAESLKPGDRLQLAGPCKDVFDARKLPAGVTLVDEFNTEEDES